MELDSTEPQWESVSFDKVFARPTLKKKKIKTSIYMDFGKIPIIDQSKNAIAGWTDDENFRMKVSNNGFIVFGDHTRVVKMVLSDFALGADGTQLLEVNDNFDTSYMYYALSNKDIPNTGYNRHFKFIREMTFMRPPIREQMAIAEALSDIDGLILITKNAILKTENTKQSILYPLLTGKASKSNVAKWQHQPLGEILEYEQPTKYLVNTNKHKEFGKYPVLTAGKSFILGYTDDEYGVYTKEETILFDDFTTDTKFVDFPFKVKSSACKMLTPRTGAINLRFVFEAIKHLKFQPYDHKRYWISEYSKLLLPLPDKHEQDSIAEVIKDFDLKLSLLKSELAKYEWLKQGMMHDLLTGEVRLV